ncbi:MAG: YgjV family protein [Clostridia bacterium]|nr:YgjV family protein [Clostridia bacterium]
MELTATYIFSQIFFLINYILLMTTYQIENRNLIVFFNLCGCISMMIAYILLEAYAGLAMVFVSIARNIIFMIDEKINGRNDITTKKDFIIMAILILACILCAIPTYESVWSLFAIIATIAYTISATQKNIKVYRWMGIISGLSWIVYNVYIKSIIGIIFEIVLLMAVIIGLIRIYKKGK